MNDTVTSVRVLLHFGEWKTRKIFHVAMCRMPKKGELLGLIFVGFATKGVDVLLQVCAVQNVVRRNLDGNLCITVSIRSDFKTPFEHIDAGDCYAISVQ